jgi:hypothetical protein
VIFALPPKSPNLNPVANICQFIRDNWFSNRVFKSFASTKKGNLLPEDEQSVKSWMIIAIADEVCGVMTPVPPPQSATTSGRHGCAAP